MPRRKIKVSQVSQNNLSWVKLPESYTSLFLGALVILISVFLVFIFAKNNNYDKINTAASTQEQVQTSEKIQPKVYEIKSGDSLWLIAEKVYGSGYNWVDLAKANNLSHPGLIHSGNKLIIPDVPKITVAKVQQTQNNSPSISGDSYKTQKGDYLWEIAIRAYGDGYKWPEIAQANSIQNPDLIYPDSVLKLPR